MEIDELCRKLLCSNNSRMQCGALYLLALMADKTWGQGGCHEVCERASVHVSRAVDHGRENSKRSEFQACPKEITQHLGIKKKITYP